MARFPGSLATPSYLPTRVNNSEMEDNHPNDHSRLAEEMIAVQATLGVNPQGDAATVGERLAATEGGASVSHAVLKAWAGSGAYELLVPTYDVDGLIEGATVRWPDGSAGVFASVVNEELLTIDGYSITHVASNQRVVQASVARDATGNVTNKPALTVEAI